MSSWLGFVQVIATEGGLAYYPNGVNSKARADQWAEPGEPTGTGSFGTEPRDQGAKHEEQPEAS